MAGDERRIVRPGRGDADADTGKRQQPGAENGGVTGSGQAEVVGVAEWAEARLVAEVEVAWARAAACEPAEAVARPAEAVASAVASRSTRRCSSRSAAAGCTNRPRIAHA